ncbi:MAG: single-stranded DNA-binding protein [Elusimicrobia bacterium]|nr:single-stranded DNA-binding protein [Elusimicrobiota bacterium]
MAELRLPEQNVVLLAGNLVKDPELKYTPGGAAMCRFRMGVNRRYRDTKSGEWKDDSTFVSVVVWRDAAERAGKALKKGSPVHVEGRLRSYDYQDKESGAKRSILEVEARRVQALEKSASAAGRAGSAAEEPEAPAGADIEEVPF